MDLVKNNVVKLVNNWDEYISTITGGELPVSLTVTGSRYADGNRGSEGAVADHNNAEG